jgi:hypothetical protein
MATATQSTAPTTFLPALAQELAEALKVPRGDVQVITDTDDKSQANSPLQEAKAVRIVLGNPMPANPNAGAGRHGFPIVRKLDVRLSTRTLLDSPGDSSIGLAKHWDFQDEVINAMLLLQVTVDGETQFLTPIKYIGADDVAKRVLSIAGAFTSTLTFEVSYSAKVTL